MQTNMSARHLPLMLSLLLLLCSCQESGHDPGKELYEQQLQQKGILAHRIDSLFTSAFTDPLGVERGLEELYLHRGISAGTLSSDPFFYSQVTYVRKALSFSLRAHSLQALLASEHFDHFQTMLRQAQLALHQRNIQLQTPPYFFRSAPLLRGSSDSSSRRKLRAMRCEISRRRSNSAPSYKSELSVV